MGTAKQKKATRKPLTTATVERRKLASLRPHPRQAEMFANLPQGELEALAKDIHRSVD